MSATASERYQLGETIDRGGQGVVHFAHDSLLNRDVAVKILREGHAPDSGAARRFVNEARITAQLQHPAIPPIHDLGRLTDGRPFLAMKLIRGHTLADEIARQRDGRTGPNLIAAFEQICQALGYAHDRKVIHRDIKPQNIMVGAFGEVQVMDWGLAKVLGKPSPTEPGSASDEITSPLTEIDPLRDPGDQTLPGSSLGTPAYMSPEQAIGAVDQIDTRTDVFGLGAVLCVILTGEPPYRGKSSESCRQQAARAQLDDAFARLATCKGDPKLVELCKRCLSPDRADRLDHAGDVANEVARIRTAADERARRAELDRVKTDAERRAALEKAVEQRKKYRLQLLMAAVVLVLVSVGTGVSIWQATLARRAEATAKQHAADADTERQAAIAARNEAMTAKGEEAKQRTLAETRLEQVTKEKERGDRLLHNTSRILDDIVAMLRRFRDQDSELLDTLQESFLEYTKPLLAELEMHAANSKIEPQERELLLNLHRRRAELLTDRDEFQEAIAAWDKALQFDTGGWRDLFRMERAIPLALSGDHRGATAEVDDVMKRVSAPRAIYLQASIYSLAAMAADKDRSLPVMKRRELANQYADRAVKLLEQAAAKGGATRKNVEQDPKFDPLRDRADFKKLLDSLPTSAPKK